jgi:DNA helicase HerA-like ATPase
VISVIEEAQSVLGRNLDDTSPFVEWVKEGRKYDLGAILVTQQPGSMAPELLSQADNWFCFHLLSQGDAGTLGKYNSHFADDILAHLIGEPIPGNCYMWSAPKQPFVLPVRIRNFENLYRDNIRANEDEPVYESSPAIEIQQRAEERLTRMAADLRVRISEVVRSGQQLRSST